MSVMVANDGSYYITHRVFGKIEGRVHGTVHHTQFEPNPNTFLYTDKGNNKMVGLLHY
jgi:hypothetical protein